MIFKSFAILFLHFILLISIYPISYSYGQETDRNPKEAYFELGKNNYIKEWLVIGPFLRQLETDFLKAYGGETNIRPYEGMKITTPDGKVLSWKRYKSHTDNINLLSAIGEHEDAVAYAACNIVWKAGDDVGAKHPPNASPSSPPSEMLEMLLGSDDGVKVWLNGELIHSNPIERGVVLDEDRVPVNLKKGVNRCLVKVDQSIGGWGFALRIIDYQGYLQSINQSLKLELSVRRQKKDKRDEKDVLSITPSLIIPKSTISSWKAPSIPKSVDVEIRGDIDVGAKHFDPENASPLQILQTREGQPVSWTVPENVQGTLSVIAKYKDNLGKTQEARFTCKAHSILPAVHLTGHWKTYDVIDGLGGSWVISILQDRNGILWFGLLGVGLCRYDGRSFKTFTKEDGLPSNDVWTIFEDSKGNLWIGTRNYFTRKSSGVCKYDGKTFKTYTTKDGLVGDAVTAIYEDNRGHLWFGTISYNYPISGPAPAGVSEFDGKTFRNYTSKDGLPSTWAIGSITQDQEGNLWFGHGVKTFLDGFGATRYDRKSFKHYTIKDGLVNNGVTSITADAQGNLWFGTSGGVSKYDGKSFQNFTTAEGLVYNMVSDLFISKNGDLWVATFGGVSRYRDGKFQNFTAAEGLASNEVMSVRGDREGNIWFATDGGVSKYDESVKSVPVKIFTTDMPIIDKKGNLWFAIPDGLCRYDGRNLQTFAMEDGLKSNLIIKPYEDRHGNIWIPTFGGLAKYDGERFQTFTKKDGLTSNFCGNIYEDGKGVLWIGTQLGGICTYDGKKFVQVAGRKELGDGWRNIGYITGDSKGNIWFSMVGYGICSYDGKKFTKFNTENGLPGNTTGNLIEDSKGNIWIAIIDGGLCRYDGKTFKAYTTKEGLAENLVRCVFEDRKGNLWFSVGSGGAYKFDGKNFQIFTTDDGLLSNNVSNILEDKGGNMIFNSTSGISIYSPPKQQIPPPVYITEIVADKVYPSPKSLKIPSTTPRISFAYYGTSFKTKRMKYNYMLEGYDKDWKATWDETISYEKLKPGKYTFKVLAINRDLAYSEKPAIVKLTLMPPFYLMAAFLVPTIGFGTILIGTTIFFGTGFVKNRRRVLAYQKAAVQELKAAREMQMSLMPKSPPIVEGFDIAGICQPASDVGGDYFTYLWFDDDKNQLAVVLMDVTSHGMKAATTTFLANGMLQSEVRNRRTPAEIMSKMHQSLREVLPKRSFVAMSLAQIDLKDMTMTYYNAALPEPILLRGGKIVELEVQSSGPLGSPLSGNYVGTTISLELGDVVIFFSDGLPEARNVNEEEYDQVMVGNLIASITGNLGNLGNLGNSSDSGMIDTAQKQIERILEDVQTFIAPRELEDDLTLVVVRVL